MSKGPAVTTSKTPAVTPIVSVAFAEHGSVALTADAHGVLALWDPATGERLANLTRATRVDTATDVSRAPVSSDGRRAASFVDGFGLQLVDLDRRTVSRPVYPDLGLASLYEVLGWSADGQDVIVGAQGVFDTRRSGRWSTRARAGSSGAPMLPSGSPPRTSSTPTAVARSWSRGPPASSTSLMPRPAPRSGGTPRTPVAPRPSTTVRLRHPSA